jgi:hypothetical protein
MKPKYSRHVVGKLWVACSECEQGGNGIDPEKCGAGGLIKNGGTAGCFLGALLGKFQGEKEYGTASDDSRV